MKLTRGGEYGIRGVLYLAQQDEGKVSMLSAIAKAQDVPPRFLAKIFQALAKGGRRPVAPRRQGRILFGPGCLRGDDQGRHRGRRRSDPLERLPGGPGECNRDALLPRPFGVGRGPREDDGRCLAARTLPSWQRTEKQLLLSD